MTFKRLLTVALMALFCAGTAMAASQLNAVQVTSAANAATVDLRTTGTYAHKEYRPDEHLMLVDLTGVTADPALESSAAVNSAALKSYKLSTYTSASGSQVTRVELALGDGVTAKVSDESYGLKIQLNSGPFVSFTSRGGVSPSSPDAARDESSAASPVASSAVASKPLSASPAAPAPPLPADAVPTAHHDAAPRLAQAKPSALAPPAEPKADGSSSAPAVIRRVSVSRGPGALDVMIEGPSSAHSFLLKNPDRLVLDFPNTVLQSSVRNIAVHTIEVREVRVGRFQSAPPVARIVIDLSGPHVFDVMPSDHQVIVRIKVGEAGEPSARSTVPSATPTPASAEPPVQMAQSKPAATNHRAHPVLVNVSLSATPVAAPVASSAASPASSPVATPAATPVVTPVAIPAAAPAVVPAAVSAATEPSPKSTPPVVEEARAVPPSMQQSSAPAAPSSHAAVKYTGEPISVNLKDVDLKDFFRLIHEISGLNIVLDPSVKGSVTLVLDDVPWDQALDIVLKNNGLDRELEGNVLRIAASDTLRKEAVERRAQSEAVALAVDLQTVTRFLSYAKAKEMVPLVKKFLTARGDVIADERTNALVISDIPSVLPSLDRLISQLDKKSQEVEIEVRVVSATRSFSRDLGFQLGFNWGNGVSTIGGSNPGGVIPTTPSGGVSSIPLFSNLPATGATSGFSLSNLTANYGIDAILTAAETHNLAKVLSRPRVVTQSNVKAEIKQGVELPVVTAATSTALASTNYINAVLRLSVTPHITADNTIFLTVDVENTQPEGAPLDGNYILSTQQATTQVLVTDGGTVVIGGIIQTTNSVTTTQTPVLGSIPWLGNLFKERLVKTETDELIFFITPKIIQT